MKRHLNLMSSKACMHEKVRRCSRFWLRTLTATLLVLLYFGLAQWWVYQQESERRDALEVQYEPFRQFKVENAKVRKKTELLLAQEQVPLRLSEETPVAALFGLVGRVVASGEGQIHLEGLQMTHDPLATSAKGPRSRAVVLEGIGMHSKAVTEFANALRTKIPFTSVELASTEAVEINQTIRQAFTIECAL